MWTDNNKAISEVNTILNQMSEESLAKIPKKLLEEIEKNATENTDYIKQNIPLEEINLQEETKEILAVICYTYFCDEEERKKWNEELSENESKYQESLREKYNPDHIFDKIENKPVVMARSTEPKSNRNQFN